jgi:hypothetical protein
MDAIILQIIITKIICILEPMGKINLAKQFLGRVPP